MTRINQYLRYHQVSAEAGDIDPGYAMLNYLVQRFELNTEQRYWLAWLYAMTYHGPSAFYIYNEFPDYENVDVGRLQRWWDARGRDEMMTQSDRRWVRSSSQFVPAFESYRALLGSSTQHEFFMRVTKQLQPLTGYDSAKERYDALYPEASKIYSMGQFALFLYLEALHTITPVDLMPTDLDLSKAWSCRYGLYYAYGLDHLVRDKQEPLEEPELTAEKWSALKQLMAGTEKPPTIWQTETILCAFRKYHRGKRYLGYYLDRQAEDIAKMQDNVSTGVYWDVLWDYRRETYDPAWLAEAQGHVDGRRLSKEWKEYQWKRSEHLLSDAVDLDKEQS